MTSIEYPDEEISGGTRCTIYLKEDDVFVGCGKDLSTPLEGDWFDMVSLARNILASENTKLICSKSYHPEFKVSVKPWCRCKACNAQFSHWEIAHRNDSCPACGTSCHDVNGEFEFIWEPIPESKHLPSIDFGFYVSEEKK